MAVTKRKRPALQRQQRPAAILALPPDVPAEWMGSGPYTVVADYEAGFKAGMSSRVIKHTATEAEAVAIAEAEFARLKSHVRVEFWAGDEAGRRGVETVVREFGGPSAALPALAAERAGDGGVERGKRLPQHERDRRARAVLTQIAGCPMQTDTLAGRLGYGRSGLNGVLKWGESVRLWKRSPYTNRWSPTSAGLAVVAGGPLP